MAFNIVLGSVGYVRFNENLFACVPLNVAYLVALLVAIFPIFLGFVSFRAAKRLLNDSMMTLLERQLKHGSL